MNIPLKQYWGLLVTYLKPQWLRVMWLAVLLFGGIGLQLINPQFIRYFIDTAQSGGPQAALLLPAGLFAILALTQRGMALATTYMAENVGWTATNMLRAHLALHCLRLDLPFHHQHTPGELIERIDGDVTALAKFFSQLVVRVLGNALLVLGILLFLAYENWRIGLGLTGYALITLAALSLLHRLAVARWAAERQASAEQTSFLEERLLGIEDIRANGAEAYTMQRLYKLMRRTLETTRAALLMGNLTFISTNFLFTLTYALGLAGGVYLYSRGEMTIGTAYLLVYYIGMLAGPLENIREQAENLQQATASIDRVEELFRTQRLVQETTRAAPPTGRLAVEFQGVSFGYGEQTVDSRLTSQSEASRPLVLQNLSFCLEPDQVLGLLGRTGSGKTTLTRLLFRLYDPTSGTIRLNGVNICDVALADLRAHVGMVTQEVQLFQASIRDNLTFFSQRISDAQLERALDELGLWEWVQSLPQGLNTRLTGGNQGLSAGEAQLLAFTRVFLKNPGLVILDEASSRLDLATEQLLERAVARLLHGRTGIIIAHRLQTVQRVDNIMILENGSILEHGPREQLANNSTSPFYHLLQTGLEEALA